MSAVADAAADLAVAAAITGVYVYPLGESITPPAVVIGPPRLEWQTNCPGPRVAIFRVYVMVALDDRSMETLWEIAPAVADAIEAQTDAVVLSADPGTYNAGAGELPCYQLAVEYPI